MGPEDLLGLKLQEAEEKLAQQGIAHRIINITPFYKGHPKPVEGGFSIVRAVQADDCLELTVCAVPERNLPLQGTEKDEL